MRQFLAVMMGVVLTLGLSSHVRADDFDPKTVPADAKWVLHMDVEAVKKSKLWDILSIKLQNDVNAQDKIQQMEAATGLRFPDDLHDVTLYGRNFDDKAGVAVVRADIDQEKIMTLLQANPAFDSSKHGDYQIVTWQDKGKQIYGSFHGVGTMIMGASRENIEAALDVLDGKSDALKADSVLEAGNAKGTLVYLAGDDLAALRQMRNRPQNPVLQQVNSAWFSLSEKDQTVVLHGVLAAADAESAQKVHTVLEGIKALVGLNGNENADPRAFAVSQEMQNLAITSKDNTVAVDWPISLETIQDLMDNSGPGATRPAVKAPTTQKAESTIQAPKDVKP